MTSRAINNNCPKAIAPELWEGMSADARYQAQKDFQAETTFIGFWQWIAIAPALLFIVLPPVQSLVNKHMPPEHFVKFNGTADPRAFLDTKTTLAKGDTVAGFEVTSDFGPRSVLDLPTGASGDHKGVDVGTPQGTPLYAPSVGKDTVSVKCWQDAGGGGLVANIASESIKDFRFKALHLSECHDGTYSAGQVLAKTGESGLAKGAPHLHLEQLPVDADIRVNPAKGYVAWFLQGSAGSGLVNIPALKESIIGQESGGDSSIVNQHSGALGLGQVMPENLEGVGKGWDFEALGKDVSAEEFLSNEGLQNEIIEHKLGEIALSQSITPDGSQRDSVEIAKRSAAVWYSGRGDYCSSTGGETFGAGAYPSGAEYCSSVGEKYLKNFNVNSRY